MQLQQRIKDACEETSESVNFRNDYSGRGMYGKRCVGITGSWADCQAVIAAVITGMASNLVAVAREHDEALPEAEDNFEQQVTKLIDFSFDQMGHDVILYWPALESLPEEELDEFDEPEHN